MLTKSCFFFVLICPSVLKRCNLRFMHKMSHHWGKWVIFHEKHADETNVSWNVSSRFFIILSSKSRWYISWKWLVFPQGVAIVLWTKRKMVKTKHFIDVFEKRISWFFLTANFGQKNIEKYRIYLINEKQKNVDIFFEIAGIIFSKSPESFNLTI